MLEKKGLVLVCINQSTSNRAVHQVLEGSVQENMKWLSNMK